MVRAIFAQNWGTEMNRPKIKSRHNAFTLTELVIVIVITGLIAAFAIPSYNKSINRTQERDAYYQLQVIQRAEEIYLAKNNTYWPFDSPTGGPYTHHDVDDINTALRLNIIENDVTYDCWGDGAADNSCTATSDTGTFTILLAPDQMYIYNPCCSAGLCQVVPACI